MRISDWSSDVCSSDLVLGSLQAQLVGDQAELAKLAQSDPAQWVAKNAEFQQRYADYQRAVQERQSLAGRMTADQDAKQSEWVKADREALKDRKSTSLNSSHYCASRMPSSA